MRKLPGVTDTLTTIGGGVEQQVNTASVYVKLSPIEQRNLSQDELMTRARQLLAQYPRELRVVIDRARAAELGVRVSDISQALNILIGEHNVSTFNQGNRSIQCARAVFVGDAVGQAGVLFAV